MLELATWLQQTSLNATLQAQGWIVPTMQAVHIIMMAIVFGSILMICLRILGKASMDLAPTHVLQRFLPWFWGALILNILTGLVLTLAEPMREFSSTSYWVKMTLLLVGAVGVFGFQNKLKPLSVTAGPTEPTQAMRVAAVATLALWLAVIILGRSIAYDIEVWRSLSLTSRN